MKNLDGAVVEEEEDSGKMKEEASSPEPQMSESRILSRARQQCVYQCSTIKCITQSKLDKL